MGYGKKWPEFWVQLASDQGQASAGNGTHIAFMAPSREAVDAFHQAGLDGGGRDAGAPGERDYTPGYYASFLHDLDGNKTEAVHMPLGDCAVTLIRITPAALPICDRCQILL